MAGSSVKTGAQLRNEEFVRRALAAIATARAGGAATPRAIAAALNARGFTTRKGRAWSAAMVDKFLRSPGARRGERGPR